MVTKLFKCNVCGNIAEAVIGDSCDFICCNQKMEEYEAKTQDSGKEKHVPLIKETPGGVKIVVGEVPHPMEEDHWIQWITVFTEDYVYRKCLEPGEAPEAEFPVKPSDILIVREHCNKHGLWKV